MIFVDISVYAEANNNILFFNGFRFSFALQSYCANNTFYVLPHTFVSQILS